jgi:hypothetical protein
MKQAAEKTESFASPDVGKDCVGIESDEHHRNAGYPRYDSGEMNSRIPYPLSATWFYSGNPLSIYMA